MATATPILKTRARVPRKPERSAGILPAVTGAARPRSRGNKAGEFASARKTSQPGRFGPYGGRYVPETLMAALQELERAYEKAKGDPKFQKRLDLLLKTYAGRPTPLFFASRLTKKSGVGRQRRS